MEIKAGFIDGNITYENWCRSGIKVYKEKLDQEFSVMVRNNNGRNERTWVLGEKFFFTSSGTMGKGKSPVFKWHLFLHPIGTKEEFMHTVLHDTEGNMSFCDGDWSAHEAELRKDKQEQEEEQKQKEVDSILASALEQYQSTYDLIQDKEIFLEQAKEDIYLYRFDAKYEESEIIDTFGEWIDCFINREQDGYGFLQESVEPCIECRYEVTTHTALEVNSHLKEQASLKNEREKEGEEFCATWGSDTKFVELTEEKKARFAEVEAGTCADIELVNEYDLYCKLRADYEELVYRKNKKGLKPTFAAIPAYFAYFCQIVEFAKKYALIDEEGNFLSWDNFNGFKKAVKRYERSLDKSK